MSETGAPAEPTGETGAQEPTQEQPAQPQEPEGGQGEQGSEQEPQTFDADYVKKLRDEAAKHRNEKNSTAQERDKLKGTLDQLRKALDPEASQEEDPAEVAKRATQERDQKDSELRELRIDRAAEKAARKHGADSDALTDSKSFAKAAADLDPTAEDFAEQMDKLVEQAVTSNPKLKASQAPARSSAAVTGGTGGKPTFTSSQIAGMSKDEYAQRESEILEALADGRVQ
ncbi:hypothetical protein [Actinopolyspora halophila]|uniref:hypothetical protein n=1 Tax=Actinopolyspora halophila TaxID=1850 RepID=UPI0003822EDC|nr:hypothetical protein [Actinopolyspora halophila]